MVYPSNWAPVFNSRVYTVSLRDLMSNPIKRKRR